MAQIRTKILTILLQLLFKSQNMHSLPFLIMAWPGFLPTYEMLGHRIALPCFLLDPTSS